jgi:TPR repeat protein
VLYRDAAKLGDSEASFLLAIMFEKGEGVSKNILKAKAYHVGAADKGHVKAQFRLGWIFEKVDRDYDQASSWYRKAAQHYEEAKERLAGIGRKKNKGRNNNGVERKH